LDVDKCVLFIEGIQDSAIIGPSLLGPPGWAGRQGAAYSTIHTTYFLLMPDVLFHSVRKEVETKEGKEGL
jgi:hypothetical protein